MKSNKIQNNRGFTIIEALVAIFILSVSVATMLAITATSEASARFSNNEITANYLLQEAIDSIRNSRDTLAFQHKDLPGGGWDKFLQRYDSCFTQGCEIIREEFDSADANGADVMTCGVDGCEKLNYDDNASPIFYNHSGHGDPSVFARTINMKKNPDNPDEIEVTAKVEWLNGDNTNLRKQTLTIFLLNWQK